jgi:hypothetical protein
VDLEATVRPKGYVLGLDGKTYRGRPLAADERTDLVGYVHHRRHDGMSVRQIVANLACEHGVRISVGSVAHYLTWTCADCSGGANDTPEHVSPIGDTS